MKRLAVSAAILTIAMGGVAAAQVAPVPPRATPPIPEVMDRDYPGVIRHEVDITDLDHRVVRVRQTIPAAPGPMTLLYPKFLPGNHAPTGPIQLLSGLTVTANGQALTWTRDTLDPYAFHIEVPAGASEIETRFEWLTQPDGAGWRVVMTQEMVNLQWEKALLYPAGYAHDRITIQPSVRMPAGWGFGVALDTTAFEDGLASFAPVSVETLADSPMFAGAHYARYDLDPGGRSPVNLHVVADSPDQVTPTDAQLEGFRDLVDQADRLFGTRQFDRYEFLLGATDRMGGIGLEHHRSSENTGPASFFGAGWAPSYGARTLLPHEYAHSWNGKYRRPADQLVPNLNTPVQNTLLWVYEGQTEYWGEVLAARAGLTTADEAIVNLAEIAAFYDHQAGRAWRPLQDTTNHNLLGYRTSNPWPSWMRGTGDYYREALLIWLDADTLIREATNDRRSLDDFAAEFMGVEDGAWEPLPYRFEDVVAALNTVHPHDWTTFLRTRLDASGGPAPLDGLARAGWRLVYVPELTEAEKRIQTSWSRDFQYSLGFSLAGSDNRIVGVRWGGPAYEQGLGAGWSLVAVGDQAASPEALRAAIAANTEGAAPIRLIVRNGERFRTLTFDYREGPKHPRLERIEGTRDRLADIFRPRRR